MSTYLVLARRSSILKQWETSAYVMYVYCVDCGSNLLSNVKIRGAGVALSFSVGNVSLQNVEISSSGTALSLPAKASLQMTNCRFYDNQYVVNAQDVSHVNVSSCVFERNQYGISLRQVQLLNFVDSQFTGALYISFSSSRGVLFIKRSRFAEGSVSMYARYSPYLSASIEDCLFNSVRLNINYLIALFIKRSRFADGSVSMSARWNSYLSASVEDCLFNSVRLNINYPTALFVKRSRFVDTESSVGMASYNVNLSASVEDCLFNASTLGIGLGGYNRRNIWSIVVANSSFHSSRVRVSTPVVPRGLNMLIVGCSFRRMVSQAAVELYNVRGIHSAMIADNIFEENSRASCIKIVMPAVSSDVTPGSINIVGNSFTNHSGANVILINDHAYHRVQLRRNVFQNPLSPFEIEVQSPWRSGYAISSSENWWGSTNHSYIAERVSDVFVDSTKAKVIITSVYSDPEMTQLEACLDPRTWNVTDGKAGGELDRNVTLTGSNIPYLVNKTIYIPQGFQLLLKENVTLHFAEKRGIIVEGMYA